MADKKQREETPDERTARQEAEYRAEQHARAQTANPIQAGDELLEGSDARKAKRKEAEQGAKEDRPTPVADRSPRR